MDVVGVVLGLFSTFWLLAGLVGIYLQQRSHGTSQSLSVDGLKFISYGFALFALLLLSASVVINWEALEGNQGDVLPRIWWPYVLFWVTAGVAAIARRCLRQPLRA